MYVHIQLIHIYIYIYIHYPICPLSDSTVYYMLDNKCYMLYTTIYYSILYYTIPFVPICPFPTLSLPAARPPMRGAGRDPGV